MNRAEFEALRDLPGKEIQGDIRFSTKAPLRPLYVAENIQIINTHAADLRMNITYNDATGSISINVHVPGTGPICRLDVDGPPHRPAGRSHKHSLKTERCPDDNLPVDVADRPEFSGMHLRNVFGRFCRMANIQMLGLFESPPTLGEPQEGES